MHYVVPADCCWIFFVGVVVSVGTQLFVIDVRFGLIPMANWWGELDAEK